VQGFCVAYIFFDTHSAVEKAIKMAKKQTDPIILSTDEHDIVTGVKSESLKTFCRTKVIDMFLIHRACGLISICCFRHATYGLWML